MSQFSDRLMLQLRDPAQLVELVAPASDVQHRRLRTLIDAVYDMPFATIHDIRDVQVLQTECQRPLFLATQTRGKWTQITPAYTHTDITYSETHPAQVLWLDLTVTLSLTLVLEIDTAEVQSILTRQVPAFATLDDFRNTFRFLDLDAFMAEHGITTVDELRDAYQYLLADIRLRLPGPFDSSHPANHYRYSLNLAILIRDTLDLISALREAKLSRATLERSLTYYSAESGAEVRTPYAPLLLFPSSSIPGAPVTESAVQAFFSAERMVAVFVALT